mmetsp:Transcript_11266/g.22680  ORF Transcript_11266/g.22680 Transcript_11266/m.22680 type:complete len:590 (+) Transcript_11266:23-1792(+)
MTTQVMPETVRPDEGHAPRKFFCGCYLLLSSCEKPTARGKTYVGFTVNPKRRIRQHNGELRYGGAHRTRAHRPWTMVLLVSGFTTTRMALQFEWAWQNPIKTRILKGYSAQKRHFYGLQGKCLALIRLLRETGSHVPWSGILLSVTILGDEGTSLHKRLTRLLSGLPSSCIRSSRLESFDVQIRDSSTIGGVKSSMETSRCSVCDESDSLYLLEFCFSCSQRFHFDCSRRRYQCPTCSGDSRNDEMSYETNLMPHVNLVESESDSEDFPLGEVDLTEQSHKEKTRNPIASCYSSLPEKKNCAEEPVKSNSNINCKGLIGTQSLWVDFQNVVPKENKGLTPTRRTTRCSICHKFDGLCSLEFCFTCGQRFHFDCACQRYQCPTCTEDSSPQVRSPKSDVISHVDLISSESNSDGGQEHEVDLTNWSCENNCEDPVVSKYSSLVGKERRLGEPENSPVKSNWSELEGSPYPEAVTRSDEGRNRLLGNSIDQGTLKPRLTQVDEGNLIPTPGFGVSEGSCDATWNILDNGGQDHRTRTAELHRGTCSVRSSDVVTTAYESQPISMFLRERKRVRGIVKRRVDTSGSEVDLTM